MMHKRIAKTFAAARARNQAVLIPFIVAGDPDLETTAQLVLEFEARGADLIELGVPFSDPMADGPANQRALARGIAGGGSLAAILATIKELRTRTQIPLILFGYCNSFLHYGAERLCADAATVGADGLLVIDLPPEESKEIARPARTAGLDLIYVLAPTTPPERARRIARSATGFLYYVTVTGVTGARAELARDLQANIGALRKLTSLPIGVGFGISTPEQAAQAAGFADAVVVGSAVSLKIEANLSGAIVPAVGDMVAAMKSAMLAAPRTVEIA